MPKTFDNKQNLDYHQRLVLSDKDRDLFLSVLENPPRLTGKLKAAIQDYQHKYDQE